MTVEIQLKALPVNTPLGGVLSVPCTLHFFTPKSKRWDEQGNLFGEEHERDRLNSLRARHAFFPLTLF